MLPDRRLDAAPLLAILIHPSGQAWVSRAGPESLPMDDDEDPGNIPVA